MLMTLKLDQRLTMSQQLRQAITLLQYGTLDLKQFLQQELVKNPLLECEDMEASALDAQPVDDYQTIETAHVISADVSHYRATSYRFEDESSLENMAVAKTLRQHLLEQMLLCRFNPEETCIAETIIDAIDEKGYLTMPLTDIQAVVNDTFIPDLSAMEKILKILQGFDPVGIAARDMQECLLLQLNAMNDRNETWQHAYAIIQYSFSAGANHNTKKLIKKLNISEHEYVEAVGLIRRLNPEPGLTYASEDAAMVEPEVVVEKHKDNWQVYLAESILTNIKINNQYQELIRQHKKDNSFDVLKKELESARSLLKGLTRRNETLLAVASYIVEMQKEFLEQGPLAMKPMNIIDAANALGLHESTISRITNGKYIATPKGVFELKYFFPSYVATQSGDTCSATSVKAYIKEMISTETLSHVLSDADLVEKLKEKGIHIARRTVAKYREAMNILPSYQRKPLTERSE